MELGYDGRYRCHSHLLDDLAISISVSSDEVAPLTEEECRILDAIDSDADRYTVYSTPGKLAWGLGLNVGDTVLARLPPQGGRGSSGGGGHQDLYTAAIIRWCGDVGYGGYLFGVEITVSIHCHQRRGRGV